MGLRSPRDGARNHTGNEPLDRPLQRPDPVQPGRVLAATMVTITVGSLPVFLLGAFAVLVRRDLAFTEAQLGIAVSVFFAASAVASTPGGWMSEIFGAAKVMRWSTSVSAAALLGIGLAARSWWQLIALLVVAGVALAASGPATNVVIARTAPAGRMGFQFGLKQSAVPAATFLAGFAVPVIGLTIGWRAAFVLAAVIGAGVFAVVAPRDHGPADVRAAGRPARGSLSLVLVVLGIAAAMGAAGGNAMTTFYVESAVAGGIGIGTAGIWLAAGSIFAIGGRLFWGWFSDRPNQGSLMLVSLLWAAGAVGFVILAFAETAVSLAAGTILAFGSGWAWQGLFHFAVVRTHSAAPAAATGITTTGMFVGGAVGPAAFGILAHRSSYTTAWMTAAGSVMCAAVLVQVGRRMLLARRAAPTVGVG